MYKLRIWSGKWIGGQRCRKTNWPWLSSLYLYFFIGYKLKGTWQWGGFSGVFAEIGSSWVPYTTFRAVLIFASISRRYSYSKNDSLLSPIRGVADIPGHWYAESPTPRITDTQSRRLPSSPIRRVGYWIFLKKTLCIDDTESRRLPAPVIRWVADSRIVELESRRLRVSVIREVTIWKKISLASIFSTLNG